MIISRIIYLFEDNCYDTSTGYKGTTTTTLTSAPCLDWTSINNGDMGNPNETLDVGNVCRDPERIGFT